MSGRDDYRVEMSRDAFSDVEIERLFAGDPPAGGRLAGLVPLVEQLRSYAGFTPSEEAVADFASIAARHALSVPPPAAKVSGKGRLSPMRLRPQLAAMALVAVLVSGMTGVAVAADGAAPGDALYGLDRALERIGVWDGQARERIEEASQLLATGSPRSALEHAIEAFDPTAGEDEARAAIDDVIETLPPTAGPGNGQPAIEEKVADMLTYIGENAGAGVGADGREFGQGVAALARGLASDEPGPEQAPGPTSSVPDDQEGEAPPEDGGTEESTPGTSTPSTQPGATSSTQPGATSSTQPGATSSTQPGTSSTTIPGQGSPPSTAGNGNGGGNGNQGSNSGDSGDPDPPGNGANNSSAGPPSTLPRRGQGKG